MNGYVYDVDEDGATTAVEAEQPGTGALPILSGVGAIEAVDRAAIDVQVTTAKAYPRSIEQFKRDALTLATLDEETAASMFYALPRGGKRIEGPSVRLAEVVAYTWGNLRIDGRIVAEETEFVTAQATCFDLEKNVAVRKEKRRRITDKNGKRYNADMIGVTCNAAISIAVRDAVFGVVPVALVRPIYLEARKASIGKAGTIQQKRQKALDWFGKAGVDPERVFHALGVKGLEDVGEDELITLRGLMTAIRDGDTTVEQAFPRPGSNGEQASELNARLSDELKEKLRREIERREEAGEESAPAADDALDRLAIQYQEIVEARHPDWSESDLRIWEKSLTQKEHGDWTAAEYEVGIEQMKKLGNDKPLKKKAATA